VNRPFILGREARAAAATAGGVGVVEHKAASHDLVFEIDRHTAQVEQALWIDDDLDPVLLEEFVRVFLGLGEVQEVAEA